MLYRFLCTKTKPDKNTMMMLKIPAVTTELEVIN